MSLIDFYNKIRLLFKDPNTFIEKVRGRIDGKIWFQDHNSKRFIQHNKKVWSDWRSDAQHSVIVFDYYQIAETEIARSYLLNILAKKHNAKVWFAGVGIANAESVDLPVFKDQPYYVAFNDFIKF